MYQQLGCCTDNEEQFGIIALPAVGGVVSAISSLFGGGGPTGAAVYREDGARWSASKQYWELPPGKKAAIQSPKPSGPADKCTGQVSCIQSMSGGPVTPAAPIVLTKQQSDAKDVGTSVASGAYPSAVSSIPTINLPGIGPVATSPLLLAGVAAIALVALMPRGRR